MSPARLAVDRSRPPAPNAPREFRFPAFERMEVAPGLEALVAPTGQGPLVHLQFLAPAGGAQRDGRAVAGLATLTASLLDQGTEQRSAPEIAAQVERLGGYLAASAGWDASAVSLGVLSERLPAALGLLADIALCPAFPAEELERVREERLADLLRRRDQPAALAEEQLARSIYGDSTYGRPILGDEKSVRHITRPNVIEFYRSFLAVRGATLLAVGDIDPASFVTAARRAFAAWRPGVAPATRQIAPPTDETLRAVVVDRPHAAQTELRLGHSGIPRRHPDFLAASVLNSILGGKFTSRINLNLRERNGYTYGASSRFSRRSGAGPFRIATAVGTENAGMAVREVIGELERLRAEPVGSDELEDAQSYLLGLYLYGVQTVEGVAGRLEDLAVFSLPDDQLERYPDEIRAVDRDRLLEIARRYLDPDRLTIVAVGPGDVLEPQLAEWSPVRIDPDGETAVPA